MRLSATILLFCTLLCGTAVAQTQLVEYEGNPVMWVGAGSSWDNVGVWTGGFLYDDTSYRMWYLGWNPFTLGVGYASSRDGIHWLKYAGNPILSAVTLWPSSCINDSGTLHLYYVLQNPTTAVYQVMHATSIDGLSWTPDTLNNPLDLSGPPGSWDDLGVDPRVIIKQDSVWKMWYNGFHNNSPTKIGYATSVDGIHWTKPSPYPVLGGSSAGWDSRDVEAGDVMSDQSGYQLWYHGTPLSQIGYATSIDGQTWTKYSGNPIFTEGHSQVNAAWARLSRVIHQRGVYKMWYDMEPNIAVPPFAYLIGFAIDSDSGYVMARPAVASFDTTHTDSTGNTIPIYLRNYGRHSAQILSVTLSSQDFELLNPPALPYTMTTGQRDTLKVRFTPQHGGMRNNTLRIVSTSAADTVFEVYLSGLATGVATANASLPKKFALDQNYPNPFNPKTVVSYSVPPSAGRDLASSEAGDGQLPVASSVRLAVYDILGREVAVLVNEKKAPGRYEQEFDGSDLASGVYFIRLTAGTFIQSRKMVLMK